MVLHNDNMANESMQTMHTWAYKYIIILKELCEMSHSTLPNSVNACHSYL